jgi:hypothetical protein
MERLNPSAFEFLIKLNGDYFLAEIDQRVVTGTAIPSAGFHTTYPAADKPSSNLCASGYPAAHVTDVYGVAITTDRLERESLDKPTPPLPMSLAELDRIPAAELQRRRKKEPHFSARVADLYDQQARN